MILVADLVRGKNVNEALNILHFSPKRSSLVIEKSHSFLTEYIPDIIRGIYGYHNSSQIGE